VSFLNNITINPETTRALFFDFDGVVLDSVNVKTEAFAELFAPFGSEVERKVVEHHLYYGGMSRVRKITHYLSAWTDLEPTQELIDTYVKRFGELTYQKMREVPFIEGALAFIQAHATEYDLHVISGTPHDELDALIRHFKLDGYFKEWLGFPTLKHDHFEYLLEKYHYQRENVLYIGDAVNDFTAAMQSGLLFIGVRGCRT